MSKVERLKVFFGGGVKVIQDSAAPLGGICTRRFSQSTDPVAKIIHKHKSTRDGICMMLSASWVGNLAQGKSLWDMVYFGGNFQAATIVTIMHNFIDDEVLNLDWAVVRRKYFVQHGCKKVRPGVTLGTATTASATLGADIVAAVDDARSAGTSTGVTIDMSGPGGAHAIAAWFSNTSADYVFFDPNYGEFTFRNRVSFAAFIDKMVKLSGYKNEFGQVKADVWQKA